MEIRLSEVVASVVLLKQQGNRLLYIVVLGSLFVILVFKVSVHVRAFMRTIPGSRTAALLQRRRLERLRAQGSNHNSLTDFVFYLPSGLKMLQAFQRGVLCEGLSVIALSLEVEVPDILEAFVRSYAFLGRIVGW